MIIHLEWELGHAHCIHGGYAWQWWVEDGGPCVVSGIKAIVLTLVLPLQLRNDHIKPFRTQWNLLCMKRSDFKWPSFW